MSAAALSARASLYRTIALRAAPRTLGALDRHELSPSAGSFDREHWAWKFRDFPLTMLQTGMLPLVELYAGDWKGNPFFKSERLKTWIVGALWHTLRRQHRNGSFDSVAPFTQDHGVTLAMVNLIASTISKLGQNSLSADLLDAAREGVRRGCRFATNSSEDYAFISNHQSLFALAWLRAAGFLADTTFLARADQLVAGILSRQSREGWYEEYGGADAGYESLGITYLAEYLECRPTEALRDSLSRAIAFLAYAVHPDGSVGGVYGSRYTSLWYPSGCEQLAGENPLADSIAACVAEGVDAGQVVTPDSVDINNLPLLVWSYLHAADHCERRSRAADTPSSVPSPTLPCKGFHGVRFFPDSGFVFAGTSRYYAVLNGRRGGVGVIHSRETGRLVHQDAGYVVRDGGATWTSALPPKEHALVEETPTGLRIEAPFGEALSVELGPLRFLVLRILSLTLFRWPALARLTTRAIVTRLLTSRRAGPLRLSREVRFDQDRIEFHDVIRAGSHVSATRLIRARWFLPTHMGSAAYFLAKDLDGISASEDSQLALALAARHEVTLAFRLVVGPGGESSLESQPSDDDRSTPRAGS